MTFNLFRKTPFICCVALVAAPTLAQTGPDMGTAEALPEVVVSATRTPEDRRDVAASVDTVDAVTLRQMGPQINLSEALQRVPGLGVLNRQNYAQDLQISSRGFGARSTFGVRGVRLYADGIPATMPDGQGQSASFDLGSAERIEVLRGPASALYGNAAGGVVQVFTEDGPPSPELSLGLAIGPDGLRRQQLKLGGQSGAVNYLVNFSHFETDGWRQHSAAQRDQFNTKLRWQLPDRATLTLVGGYLNMPGVQDPLGLTRAQLAADPRQSDANALRYNTRKDIENGQLGLVYERPVGDDDSLRLMAYGGSRQVRQFQSIPAGVQSAATHPGGIIDFSRDYQGLDARYTWRTRLAERPFTLTGGASLDEVTEQRQGYQNFIGSTLGVVGALRRDERNRARNSDQYLQADWAVAERWSVGAGLRHSRVRFSSRDQYIVPGNGDDSGAMRFQATTPLASVMFKPSDALHLYASASRSFETPTLNEVAYRRNAGTEPGWNLGLKASRARHLEVGLKSRPLPRATLDVAVFSIHTDDEIAVDSNQGGRSTFKNVGRTQREGVEASSRWTLNRAWSAYSALTLNRARYQDAFNTVAAGNTLPGVPSRTAYAELAWRPASTGWQGALELRHSGRLWANDVNDEYAPAYTVWALRGGWRQVWGQGDQAWRLDTLARIDNLRDTRHVGSVIVNEGNRRYYEAAPGRTLMVSATLTRAF
ncbi:TonB-dependent receptor [Aquabacterium soli]|uniref:TonB-dependent receptor n=1 Tax=Aquabacterium soli TaxID=2493092 RepID=A0A3R8S8N4_9BURK|nr:TonB-dependent receptor [Aquabacterium soli]RRS04885.1 TonB-dependent receptor [Aquabacterium soli]